MIHMLQWFDSIILDGEQQTVPPYLDAACGEDPKIEIFDCCTAEIFRTLLKVAPDDVKNLCCLECRKELENE